MIVKILFRKGYDDLCLKSGDKYKSHEVIRHKLSSEDGDINFHVLE